MIGAKVSQGVFWGKFGEDWGRSGQLAYQGCSDSVFFDN